ncbi:hypothetical protein EMCRGX_G030409 [Ephydatia muelleri]
MLFNTCSYGKDFTSWMVRLWQWSLVRHTAGMLKKRVEDLGPAATDLLVPQKHFSVGQPNNEIHITQRNGRRSNFRFSVLEAILLRKALSVGNKPAGYCH